MLQKDTPFQWTKAEQGAFENLKQILVRSPVFAFSRFDLPFRLETDASATALGFVLSLKHADGLQHPVVYGGRSLRPPEVNYSTTERELLSIIYAVQKLQQYLKFKHFTIVTDQSALR